MSISNNYNNSEFKHKTYNRIRETNELRIVTTTTPITDYFKNFKASWKFTKTEEEDLIGRFKEAFIRKFYKSYTAVNDKDYEEFCDAFKTFKQTCINGDLINPDVITIMEQIQSNVEPLREFIDLARELTHVDRGISKDDTKWEVSNKKAKRQEIIDKIKKLDWFKDFSEESEKFVDDFIDNPNSSYYTIDHIHALVYKSENPDKEFINTVIKEATTHIERDMGMDIDAAETLIKKVKNYKFVTIENKWDCKVPIDNLQRKVNRYRELTYDEFSRLFLNTIEDDLDFSEGQLYLRNELCDLHSLSSRVVTTTEDEEYNLKSLLKVIESMINVCRIK